MYDTIRFRSCTGLITIQNLSSAHRINNESWWVILSENRPTRFVKFSDGFQTANLFLKHYQLVDEKGCLNHNAKWTSEKKLCTELNVPTRFRHVNGVPQRVYNSGLCWYCAMCFCMFFSQQMRTLLCSKLPKDMQQFCDTILVNPEDAETFRRLLYSKYSVGDKPDQNPELDGQNGFGQFCILLAKLKIPLIRILAPGMEEIRTPVLDQDEKVCQVRYRPLSKESSILCVRCFRTQWHPQRRIDFDGRRYHLCCIFIGSEYCGHQIGASTCDMRVCRWACADSDASQHGIGPVFWSIRQNKNENRGAFKKRWWSMWKDMIPMTVFNSNDICDLSPHNRESCSIKNKKKSTKPGVVNMDYVYISHPHETM